MNSPSRGSHDARPRQGRSIPVAAAAALAAVLSLAAVWLVSSRVLQSVIIAAAAFAAVLVALLGRGRETREQPPETAAPREAPPADTPREGVSGTAPDPSVWNEWKRIWTEADQLLSQAPKEEVFSDTWTSFTESLEKLQTNSKSILENSRKAFDISDNLARSAEKAFALSQKVQTRVKELTGELAESLGDTRRLFDESKKIAGILEMMSEISSKTYVLSINASVVATRAGVHGRAFDVVAKEIRKLAQDTETSLKSIEDFVTHIQDIVQRVVDNTTVTASEIEKEKESLLSVAGSLQGVILAVEIIRTVSNLSRDKALEQQSISEEVIAKTKAVASRMREESSSRPMEHLKEKIGELRRILDRY